VCLLVDVTTEQRALEVDAKRPITGEKTPGAPLATTLPEDKVSRAASMPISVTLLFGLAYVVGVVLLTPRFLMSFVALRRLIGKSIAVSDDRWVTRLKH
jgi:hypothetical protein